MKRNSLVNSSIEKSVALVVPPNTTGFFQDTNIPERTVDIDLKTTSFYIDWDNADGDWKFILPSDKEQLAYTIERMKEAVTTKAKEDNIS